MADLSPEDIKTIKKMNKKHRSSKYTNLFIVLGVFAVAAVIFLLNFTTLPDKIKNIGYTPEESIGSLIEKVGFTDKGATIFKASRPALESQKDFNEHCDSHNIEISVLGCYTNNQIYLYDIKSKELNGIVESTAAHEMLHAAWARLHSWEKANLEGALYGVYREHSADLGSGLENYNPDDLLDELHSRIGTEVANLPDSLEKHYAQYFTDQDAVVKFYDKYAEPFRKLEEQAEDLRSEIELLGKDIDTRTQSYYSSVEKLSSTIDEFNNCASTVGCFKSSADFNTRRAEILAEQSSLEEEYNSLNNDILRYNSLVEQYNNTIVKTEELESTINSNILPEVERLPEES